MPKLAVWGHLIFHLYSYDLSERLHVHISNTKSRKSNPAKIWLDTVDVFENVDPTARELSQCQKILRANSKAITPIIDDFRNGRKTKSIQQ
ncbi:MAG: DUF4160 domain-containing protein [Rudanella sp.]|nr:DUF4160 domain-containing protein [Rudanella sp.]